MQTHGTVDALKPGPAHRCVERAEHPRNITHHLEAENSAPSTPVALSRQPSGADDIYEHLLRRRELERWTAYDDHAAFLQASLLSFRSVEKSEEDCLRSRWNVQWNQDGSRDVPCKPEDYKHNCPWNDWVPPSESNRRFEAAKAVNAALPTKTRVRVHLCLSAVIGDEDPATLIVFATVEDKLGKPTLILRRGSDVLAEMVVATIFTSLTSEGVVMLQARSRFFSPAVYLIFETHKRLETFAHLIAWDLPSDA